MSLKTKIKQPFAIRFTIPEHRLQEIRNSTNGCLKSDTFDIPGTDIKYFVDIFPNDEDRGKVCIYLNLKLEESKEIEAKCTLFIDSADYSAIFDYVYKKPEEGYGDEMCTTDELFDPEKRFIVNGFMDIKVEGFLMIEKDAPLNFFELSGNGNILGIDLWNQPNKDFTIIADGKEIGAHKIILSTRSPVFAAMFQPHTKEAQENKVTIPDFSFNIVEAAIKLCYHYSLVPETSLEEKILLLQFFDKYDIQSLKSDLEKYLITQTDESNVCKLANGSIIANASNLQNKCTEFLQDCMKKTKAVSDFDELDKEFAFDLLKNSFCQHSKC